MNKLKESFNAMKQQKNPNQNQKQKCKYKWKCWWPKSCRFDHSYLHRKINAKEKLNAEVTKMESKGKSEIQCEDCSFKCKTRKKLKKHENRVHKIKCDVCQKHFVSIINLQEHVEQEHKETEAEYYQLTKEKAYRRQHLPRKVTKRLTILTVQKKYSSQVQQNSDVKFAESTLHT